MKNIKEFINNNFIKTVDYLLNSHMVSSKKELADNLGLRANNMSEVLSGRQNVGIDVVLKLCDLYNISVEYQLKGIGEMFVDLTKSLVGEPIHNSSADSKITHNSVFVLDTDYLDDEVEVFTNSNGNRFYLYPNGRIEIEVLKVPFPAYASYIECYQDEMNCVNGFEYIRFKADHIAKGNYICFVSEGESMNGGMLDDTPGGSEILAREVGRQFWDNLHSTKYGLIFVTKSGIMHKDIGGYNKETGKFTLLSRNPEHKPFEYSANDVYQIFNVIKRSF
ncbi:helix-turn-helix transcriptional regulator [Myroides sp. NP-2]|uniref:helix-turn-helix domain-containing protein n=1 Tax=Myroides sp. NP-2 TaxID=2759945 RepID=UPI0015F8B2AC|nr:helix-turn-helix transcriptional regulator [Myroides sp. NP-2]MBB1150426.1 helix-turn-helix transcriptional regulator [Myroides sp. NP-2]